MAASCLPYLSADFVDGLTALRPTAVVNIEPCYEHCDSSTLIGVLRRRYIEVNDYNRNLVTLLREQERAGKLPIHEEQQAVIGINPLFPVSVIVWSPYI